MALHSSLTSFVDYVVDRTTRLGLPQEITRRCPAGSRKVGDDETLTLPHLLHLRKGAVLVIEVSFEHPQMLVPDDPSKVLLRLELPTLCGARGPGAGMVGNDRPRDSHTPTALIIDD